MTDIHTLAKDGKTEEIKATIAKDRSLLDKKHRSGCTALILVARKGNTETAQAPIALGADIHAEGNEGFTALIWAAF